MYMNLLHHKSKSKTKAAMWVETVMVGSRVHLSVAAQYRCTVIIMMFANGTTVTVSEEAMYLSSHSLVSR